MTLGISADTVWKMYNKVVDSAEELRTYVNAATRKFAGGIDNQLTNSIDAAYEKPFYGDETEGGQPLFDNHQACLIDKKQVEILIDKIYSGCSYVKTAAIVSGIGLFLISQYTPFFSGLFHVGTLVAAVAANEFNEMHKVAWEAKKQVECRLDQDQVRWKGELENIVNGCSALLQSRLSLFNHSLFFGEEIRLMSDFVTRKIEAAQEFGSSEDVKWVPDRTAGRGAVYDYIKQINTSATAVESNFSQEDAEQADTIQSIVQQALRPIAFARLTLSAAALTLYTASTILPFSTLFWVASIATAFFAYDFHQVHASIRSEISEKLFENWGQEVNKEDFTKWVKHACLRIQNSTWILHRNFMFGKEIKKIQKDCDKLIKANRFDNSFELSSNNKGALTSVINAVKNWTICQPLWARNVISDDQHNNDQGNDFAFDNQGNDFAFDNLE